MITPPTPLQGLSTPVKRQSSTRREPLQIRCQSIANPVSMKHQSGPILCQSSANLSPIHGHQGNGNLMSMHSHSCANQVPSHIGANPFQSNKGMPNQCGSNPLQINRKNDHNSIQSNANPSESDVNPVAIPQSSLPSSPTICQSSANLPIYDQSIIQLTTQLICRRSVNTAILQSTLQIIVAAHALTMSHRSCVNPEDNPISNLGTSVLCG